MFKKYRSQVESSKTDFTKGQGQYMNQDDPHKYNGLIHN